MPSYIVVILMPLSYGVLLNFISNNLSACLSQLRTLLESLIRFAYADLNDSSEYDFIAKIQRIEKLRFGELVSKVLNGRDAAEAKALWKNLSIFWVHPTGLMLKIVDHMIKHRTLPGFGLPTPVPFSADEKQNIRETYKSVKRFRKLLRKVVRKWAKQHEVPLKDDQKTKYALRSS